jgi:hypothetical protein
MVQYEHSRRMAIEPKYKMWVMAKQDSWRLAYGPKWPGRLGPGLTLDVWAFVGGQRICPKGA